MRVQVRRWMAPVTLAVGLCAGGASRVTADEITDPQSLNGLLRLFADSKHVLVRSLVEDATVPFKNDVTLSLHWNNERVVVPAISAPAGSQEAVDAITTASRPIAGNAYEDFIKVRNELVGTVARGGAAVISHGNSARATTATSSISRSTCPSARATAGT